jgi:hypothetical protein
LRTPDVPGFCPSIGAVFTTASEGCMEAPVGDDGDGAEMEPPRRRRGRRERHTAEVGRPRGMRGVCPCAAGTAPHATAAAAAMQQRALDIVIAVR